jgi:hypothetical protein
MFGGYNKVTKNDQWNRIYIKMGLPDEPSTKTSRAIEHAYKKYEHRKSIMIMNFN